MTGSSPRNSIVVLVVEDEALLRFVIADMLEARGFVVREAADATEALLQLELHSDIELVFSDVQMPGEIDGLDLIRIVHRRWPRILLMLTSGRLRPSEEELPDDARFVPKPASESELLRQINDLISKYGEHPSRC